MIKQISIFILSSTFLMFSCADSTKSSSKKTELKERIKTYEDSLMALQKDPQKALKITSLAQIELINRLTAYSRAFPSDNYSAVCLFKTHMIYENLRAPLEARAYADTLLERFPNFKQRKLVLESLASSYDMNSPRDTSKVRLYFELLLKEPGIDAERKKDIKERLKHLELTFEEYIMQMP
jgi:outer membrane protein assembly factor BamD (BamD/ComL family)